MRGLVQLGSQRSVKVNSEVKMSMENIMNVDFNVFTCKYKDCHN